MHSPVVFGNDYYPFGMPMAGRQITRENHRYGYQGQFSEQDSLTGWNMFELRMYDARFGRWLSPDPYGQYASPYNGMGNMPHAGVDPDGGWNWVTAGIGAVLGAGIGYAKTGDWQGALKGALIGGAIGGASFEKKNRMVSAGSQTGGRRVIESFIGLSSFGKFLMSNPGLGTGLVRGLRSRESQQQSQDRATKFHYFCEEEENKALEYMLLAQELDRKEISAFYVERNNERMIIVTPWYRNTRTRSWPGQHLKRGTFYDDDGYAYKPLLVVHTHPDNDWTPSEADVNFARGNKIKLFVLTDSKYTLIDGSINYDKFHSPTGNTSNLLYDGMSLFNYLK